MDNLEKAIIRDLKKNDVKAFDLLFNTYYVPLYHYAYDIVGKTDISKEVVHDLFVKVWKSRKTLTIKSTLKGYLYRSVHNLCLNYLRDSKNAKSIDVISIDDEKSQVQLINLNTPPEIIEKIYSTQLESFLKRAMEELPEQSRRIFYLSRFENLTYPEIATKLNLALSTVKTQMLRAISKLKDALEDKI